MLQQNLPVDQSLLYLLQPKEMLVLPEFKLSDIASKKALEITTTHLQSFTSLRYQTDTIHFVASTDGEWQQSMNQSINDRKDIGLGVKPMGMGAFFVECPEAGYGLEPTYDTNWAFSRLFNCTDRLEANPDPFNRKKLVFHDFIFFSPKDIQFCFKRNPEYYCWLMGCIDQKRRCIMTDQYQRAMFAGIVLTDENGVEYDLYFKVYDVCALVGIATLKEACRVAGAAGFTDKAKRLMDKYKTKMTVGYTLHHEMFIEYGLNDLNLLEMVAGIGDLWDKVCSDMGVPPINLKLTMGANVVSLQERIIAKKLLIDGVSIAELGIKDTSQLKKIKVNGKTQKVHPVIDNIPDLLSFLNQEASAKWLATRNDDNKYLLAAVDGGRCKNELPRRTRLNDLDVETDISEFSEYWDLIDSLPGYREVKKETSPMNIVGFKYKFKSKRRQTTVVVDTDIDGCYGNGLMNQVYPIGRPTIISYKSSKRERPTLKEFISNQPVKGLYKGFYQDLVKGLWSSRWSTTEKLSFDVDLLLSKIGLKPKSEEEVMSHDSEGDYGAEMWTDGNTGEIGGEFVLLRREMVCVMLTHDILQVLKRVCTAKEWKELTEKLMLDALIYYPKSEQVDTAEELFEAYRADGSEDTELVKDETRIRKNSSDNRSHKWMALNMGEDWVDRLACLRKTYAKGTPENTFYKLIINCIYGVACSVFFPTFSNVVVANNITARARALAWMMAKTNRGQASITDGSTSGLNEVLYWVDKKPGMHTLSNLDNLESLPKSTRSRLKIAPLNLTVTDDWEVGKPWEIVARFNTPVLGDDGQPELDDKGNEKKSCWTVVSNGDVTIEGCENNWGVFDTVQWNHMKRFFGSGIDILDKTGKKAKGIKADGSPDVVERDGQFAFEIKDIYRSASFQSQSNYLLIRADGDEKLKARGQNPKKTQYLTPYGDESNKLDTPPIKTVLHQILNKQPVTPQQRVFTPTVLKVRNWKEAAKSKNANAVQENSLFPGDTTHKTSRVTPISYSMFRYLDEEQYLSWKKQHEKLRSQYGWGLEGLYVDEQGNLDYDYAVNAIQTAIDEGKKFPRLPGNFPTHPYKPEDLDFDTEDSELITDIDW